MRLPVDLAAVRPLPGTSRDSAGRGEVVMEKRGTTKQGSSPDVLGMLGSVGARPPDSTLVVDNNLRV